ncbi:MAG: DUF2461 domain-containing protein [Actinomycetia bacterium]|nr:DUF2461 domain-containing protein [Actinomycetes bacterium]
MSSVGIPTAALDFYEDLEADNTKSFWTAHKHIYDEQVRAPMEALATALAEEFGGWKMFRPYRDVRFARDKTPYKTQQGVWFAETARYFHISAAGLFVAGGYWDTPSPQVDRLRRAVADDIAGAALERAIQAIAKAGLKLSGEQLTRVPNGYPKDHPRADLLRYKSLVAERDFGSPAWLPTERALAEITKAFRAVAPLVDWLDGHVGRG